jgi:hypothetical protein
MKRIESLAELRREYGKVHSSATGTDRWLAQAFMWLIDNGFVPIDDERLLGRE